MKESISYHPGNRLVAKGTVLEEQRPEGIFLRQRSWLFPGFLMDEVAG